MARVQPILVRVLAALLIGAVVTVGVAVGCAMVAAGPYLSTGSEAFWSDPLTGQVYLWVQRRRGWDGFSGAVVPLGPRTKTQSTFSPIVKDCPFPREAAPSGPSWEGRYVRAAGWPWACVWGAAEFVPDARSGAAAGLPSPVPTLMAIGATPIGRPLDQYDPRGICGYLPVTPIWSGLALDTLFYGAIAWSLLFLPPALRRWRRRRAGRCVTCGYDRVGLAAASPCPECGLR